MVEKLSGLKLERNNFIISLIVRKKQRVIKEKTFDFVVGKVSRSNKIMVIEKLGSISYSSKRISINFFRLAFWLKRNPIVSFKAHIFLIKYVFKKFV